MTLSLKHTNEPYFNYRLILHVHSAEKWKKKKKKRLFSAFAK